MTQKKNKWQIFQDELTSVLNRHCMDNETNTPDFLLAEQLTYILYGIKTFNTQNMAWHKWDSIQERLGLNKPLDNQLFLLMNATGQ